MRVMTEFRRPCLRGALQCLLVAYSCARRCARSHVKGHVAVQVNGAGGQGHAAAASRLGARPARPQTDGLLQGVQ
eukprot:2948638-Prymnesium_polylepis.1